MDSLFFTIDFWQTLYDSSNGEQRNGERKDVLYNAVLRENGPPEREFFEEAYRGLWGFFDEQWLGRQRTPTSGEMVAEMLRRLDVTLSEDAVSEVVGVFEEGILHHPPALLPGVREALAWLKERGPLAIISDTAFSPGSVLKQLMERDGIAGYFDHFIFSDETGVAKPHPDAFLKALDGIGGSPERGVHIGDIERTDIVGAKGVGMTAVLYRTPDRQHKYAEEESVADHVLEKWEEIERIIPSIPL